MSTPIAAMLSSRAQMVQESDSARRRGRWSSLRTVRRWITIGAGACGLTFGFTGCSALDATNPTRISGSSLDNPSGARDLWTIARVNFFLASSTSALYDGIFSDEFFIDAVSTSTSLFSYVNRRDRDLILGRLARSNNHGYAQWKTTRSSATVAMSRVRAYSPTGEREAHLAELFALRGFSALRLAESFCPGFPLHDLENFKPVYGPPLTTEEALAEAVTEFDSALVYAKDSARVLNFARVGKARALIGLGRFAEAAAAAAPVTQGYETRGQTTDNVIYDAFLDWQSVLPGIGDREGGVGLDFVSSADPRVGLRYVRKAKYGDTSTVMYGSTKYGTRYPTIVVANDIEARLIQAEAALNAHDGAWLTILNDLRATRVTPALPALADPGSFAAQVDLLFRERALWLFATGHRLGDLRRLVRLYGRAANTVFPNGTYRPSGTYGTATSLPFNPVNETPANPAVTGCTD